MEVRDGWKIRKYIFDIAVGARLCVVRADIRIGSNRGGGSIQGTITDSGGSVVPGATVVATNVATRVESTRQTNEAGLYVISPLPPGEYKVSVSATGFQTFSIMFVSEASVRTLPIVISAGPPLR